MNTESQTDQDRITQLEASCAAYRKLIVESIYDINGHLIEWPSQAEWFRVISSTDAGKSLLDRLQKAEAERDQFKQELEYISQNLCGTKVEGDVTHDMVYAFVEGEIEKQAELKTKAQDRLQAVEKERDEWRKTAGERLDLLTKAEGRALELLERLQRYETALQKLSVFRIAQESLQPAQKDAPQKGTK